MKERTRADYQKKIITIPNILSFFRVCLIPVIVWAYCVKENSLLTAGVLVLSGVTDVVDGIIARKCNMVSDFGKAFDPVADKLTQVSMLCCLVIRFPRMLLPLGVMVVKEVCTGIMSLLSIKKSGKIEGAVWHGKVTTVLLYSMMALHILWAGIPETASDTIIGIVTGMMVFSAIGYSIRHLKSIRSKG
jgi:cardiolipin synthase